MIYLGPNYSKIGGPIDISHFLSPLKLSSLFKCWSSGHSTKKTSKNFLSQIIRENFFFLCWWKNWSIFKRLIRVNKLQVIVLDVAQMN